MRSGVIAAALAIGDSLEFAQVMNPEMLTGNVYAGVMDAVLAKIERGWTTAESWRRAQFAH